MVCPSQKLIICYCLPECIRAKYDRNRNLQQESKGLFLESGPHPQAGELINAQIPGPPKASRQGMPNTGGKSIIMMTKGSWPLLIGRHQVRGYLSSASDSDASHGFPLSGFASFLSLELTQLRPKCYVQFNLNSVSVANTPEVLFI